MILKFFLFLGETGQFIFIFLLNFFLMLYSYELFFIFLLTF